MKEAMGSTFSLTAIVVFLIIVNCFLAFSVNYTKAFRAKNEIRSIIEKNEGLNCQAVRQITEFLKENNYHIGRQYLSTCDSKNLEPVYGPNNTPLFCYKVQKVNVAGNGSSNITYKGAYYTVATFVNVDVPMLGKIFESLDMLGVFMVKGETALIYSSGNNSEISGCSF